MIKILKPVIAACALLFCISIAAEGSDGIHKQVDELILKGDLKKAEAIAEKAYKKYPDDVETICARACVYRNSAYKSGIRVDTSKLGIKDNESGTAELTSSLIKDAFKDEVYYDEEIFSKAEPLYHRAIELDKSYLNAYFNLLNTYMVMGNFNKYFNVIDLLIKNQKENKNIKDILLDLAAKLYKQKSYEAAERLYLKIIEVYPDFTYAKSDLGSAYYSTGKIKEGAGLFREVYEKDPGDQINASNLMKAYIALEDFSGALQVAESLLKQKDSDYFYYYYAGNLAYITGKKYSDYFSEFIELRNNDTKNQENDFYVEVTKKLLAMEKLGKDEKRDFLEYVLFQFFENNYDYFALVTANLLLKNQVTKNSLIIMAGIYDTRIHFPEKAITYLDKIREFRKTDESIMSEYDLNYNYGTNYFNLKRYDEALKYFTLLYEKDRNNANVLYGLGRSYHEKGDTGNACSYYNMAGKLNDKESMYSINQSIRAAVKIGCFKKEGSK